MKHAYPILIVEDDANDVFLVQHAFRATSLPNPLHFVHDGQSAMEYLRGEGQFADRSRFPFPGLVLLDLKLPRRNGFEVLEWMRKDACCKLMPVIILSSSALAEDVNRAYNLGANAYMVKPADFRALERLLATIGRFWQVGEPPRFELARSQPRPSCQF
jgi:CheY-like chemotaxis protein